MINQEAFREIFGDNPNNNDPSLFADGQRDCKKGVDPKNNHPSYLAGYGFQYELEQIRGCNGYN